MELLKTAKSIIRNSYPQEVLRQQNDRVWRGSFGLPEELKKYYLDLGPVNVEIGDGGRSFYFPSLFDLCQYQVNYDTQPSHRAVVLDDSDHWVAIGDDGIRPFFFSTSHGVVCYEDPAKKAAEQLLFPNIGCLMQVVSLMSEVAAESKMSLVNPVSGEINDTCKEQAYFKLVEFTGSIQISRNVLKAFGWF